MKKKVKVNHVKRWVAAEYLSFVARQYGQAHHLYWKLASKAFYRSGLTPGELKLVVEMSERNTELLHQATNLRLRLARTTRYAPGIEDQEGPTIK